MECLTGKDLFKTLKCLDIDTAAVTSESLDWLFDNKETSSILNWLCTYVNESNIESNSEIYDYTNLQEEGTIYSENDIDNALCRVNTLYPDILDVNTQQITYLKQELDIVKKKEENLNKLSSKYLALDSKLSHQLRVLVEDEINSRITRQSYSTECVAKAKKVDDFHDQFYDSVTNLSEMLSNYKSTNYKRFVSQMPLNIYKQHCENFNKNLSLWIRKNFEVEDNSSLNVDVEFIDREINRLKYVIEESVINLVKAECAEKEMKAKLNYLRNNECHEISEEEERVQEIQLTSRINTLCDDLERLYVTDLQQVSEQFSQNLIDSVLLKNAELKLNKCKDILKLLKSLNSEVTYSLAQSELFFLLLKTDKVKIQAIDKFLEDIYFYSANYLKQHAQKSEIMSKIEAESKVSKPLISDIVSIITEDYSTTPLVINEVLTKIEKQKVTIENLENDIFVLENKKCCQTIKTLEQKLEKTKEYIWSGPTMQPIIIPFDYLDNLSNANLCLEKVNKSLRSCMEDYKQTLSRLEKNRWLKYKRLLWAWFLVKPEKVPAAIDQLREFLIEQARNNT